MTTREKVDRLLDQLSEEDLKAEYQRSWISWETRTAWRPYQPAGARP